MGMETPVGMTERAAQQLMLLSVGLETKNMYC